jgi:hypothetical protein
MMGGDAGRGQGPGPSVVVSPRHATPNHARTLSMTRRRLATLAVAALGLAVAWSPRPAAADDKNATGTWKWTVNRNGEEIETVLKLKQEGEKVTGTITGRNGQETEIKDGEVKG